MKKGEKCSVEFGELCRERNQFSCPLLLMPCIYITETTTKDSQQRLHLHVKAERLEFCSKEELDDLLLVGVLTVCTH